MSDEGMAGTAAGHNSAARAETIRSIINTRREIEGRIAELMAERKKNQGRIKSDLGMKVADFNALYRIAELEHEDRDTFLDTLREGFAALGIGQQGNFLDFLDPKPAANGALPKWTAENSERAGEVAFGEGQQEDHFPSSMRGKKMREHFMQGWKRASALATAAKMAEGDGWDKEEESRSQLPS